MADTINSVVSNSDGSYVFNITFDSGTGIFGNSNVLLPAPSPDANGNVTPYTDATAKGAVLPIALAQKNAWVATLTPVTGPVTL